MTKVRDLHREWMKDPSYRKAYDDLKPQFEAACALIEARADAGLSQEQLARRMKTTQSAINRIEGGRGNPSVQTLQRAAAATGTRVRITFEPKDKKKQA